jgi:hypothetical protein
MACILPPMFPRRERGTVVPSCGKKRWTGGAEYEYTLRRAAAFLGVLFLWWVQRHEHETVP